jgi:ectoine hydroxylase-related dioxygenase (phytanoyl-CoA dioxygenase family)
MTATPPPDPDPAHAAHLARLREQGYTVLERLVPPDTVAALIDGLDRLERTLGRGYARTSFEGYRTVRMNLLPAHDAVFWQVALQPQVLALAEAMLDRELLLHSLCSLILGPGQEAQPIHEDTQMIPLPRPHAPIVVNALWALSDFTAENGATLVVPGSHRLDHAPEYGRHYDAQPAIVPAGSVILIDSALWHGAGANISAARRYALSCSYCAGWMRQQENYQLGVPREVAARFPRRLQELCGYSVYKGQFGHIDNHDPIELLGQPRGRRMVWEATDAKLGRTAPDAG